MTAPILTLAEVQALSGFTDGPWRVAHTAGHGGLDSHKVYADMLPGYSHPRCVGEANRYFAILADQQLIAAAPALHATCLHLFAEVARLTAELAAVSARLPAAAQAAVAERDTLAARVAALEAHNGRMAELLNKVADAMGAAEREPIWTDGAEVVTNALPTAATLRALAGGAS